MDEKYVITIGRQLGSGGREIGEKLAGRLAISFYDKELIRLAAQESGLKEEFFEKADEKKRYPVFAAFFGLKGSTADEIYSNYYLSNETLFQFQSNVILNLAEKQSCLFVGRSADYVLKEHPRCLNVFITADIYDRVQRIKEIKMVSAAKAREIIEKTDKKRSGYYNYFTGKVWGAAESYHLSINSSVLGIDDTVEFFITFVKKRFAL
ncbi:MAG: cytidylate kinase-like family protein [Bacteroidales bacterium]|nr:cytidylate kinase-like family protein [Bacteroidales bacterium]